MGYIEDDQATKNRLFPYLKYLSSVNFSRFLRMYRKALPFLSLKDIEVHKCPELKELPLRSDSAKNSLRIIKGEEEWWDGLQWDDPATNQVFSAKFVR